MSAETRLSQAFASQHPDEVARLLESLPPSDFAEVLAALHAQQAGAIVARAVPLSAALALTELDAERAAAIVLELETRVATLIIARLTEPVRERMYDALPAPRAAALRTLMLHGEARAAGRMDPAVTGQPETLTVSAVLERQRATPHAALNYVYAVDAERRLRGVLSLRELLGAAPETPLSAIMVRSPQALAADDPLEAIASHPAWKRLHALPVIDRDGRMLGALRYSVFRAIEEELGERLDLHESQVAPALAELYTLGVRAVLQLAGSSLEPRPEPPTSRGKVSS